MTDLDSAFAASGATDCRVSLAASGGPGGETRVTGLVSVARRIAVLDVGQTRHLLIQGAEIFVRSDRSGWLSTGGSIGQDVITMGFGALMGIPASGWERDERDDGAIVAHSTGSLDLLGQEQVLRWCFQRTPLPGASRRVRVSTDDAGRLERIEMVFDAEPDDADHAARFLVTFDGSGVPGLVAPEPADFARGRVARARALWHLARAR